MFVYTEASFLVAEETGLGAGPEAGWWGGRDLQVEGNTPGTGVPCFPPLECVHLQGRQLLETARKSFA